MSRSFHRDPYEGQSRKASALLTDPRKVKWDIVPFKFVDYVPSSPEEETALYENLEVWFPRFERRGLSDRD